MYACEWEEEEVSPLSLLSYVLACVRGGWGGERGVVYSRITSEPLIEDEEANRTVMPKFYIFILVFFDGKSIHRYFE